MMTNERIEVKQHQDQATPAAAVEAVESLTIKSHTITENTCTAAIE